MEDRYKEDRTVCRPLVQYNLSPGIKDSFNRMADIQYTNVLDSMQNFGSLSQ